MSKYIPHKIRCKNCKHCKVVGAGVALCNIREAFVRPNMQIEKCFEEKEEQG